VYGDPEISPQVEEYWGRVNPIGIRSCYDEGKRAAETLFFDYHRQHKVDVRVARIFNTYGPRMAVDDGRVVSNFICQSLQGEPISIYGNGSQTRSFCYVDDLVGGLLKLFFAEDIHEPINLGNPTPISMLELANEIVSLTCSKSELIFLRSPRRSKTKGTRHIKSSSALGLEASHFESKRPNGNSKLLQGSFRDSS
jgi:UDP-glucuronate decarboxylase